MFQIVLIVRKKMNQFFELLTWDTDFFGFKVAKVKDNLPKRLWHKVIKQLQDNQIMLAYWEEDPHNIQFQHFAQKYHARMVDLKTTFYFELSGTSVAKDFPANISIYQESQPTEQLIKLAVQSGEYSRFKNDPNIPINKFVELYQLWIINSVTHKLADAVIIEEQDNLLRGFITVFQRNNIGHIGLVAVDNKFRGFGIGKKLIESVKIYFKNLNINKIMVVTQGYNQIACELYKKSGFVLHQQKSFYHFWINNKANI